MADIDYIRLRPDRIGWTLIVYTEQGVTEYGLGDVIQFTEEVDRTLGKWLADGPADFHASNIDPDILDSLKAARLALIDDDLLDVRAHLDNAIASFDPSAYTDSKEDN